MSPCRSCHRPTEEGRDFCVECTPRPRERGTAPLRLIEGGKSPWERREREPSRRRWLRAVPRMAVPPSSPEGS